MSRIPSPRFRPSLEALEDRRLPAHYTLTPVVPAIDAEGAARLSEVVRLGQARGNRLTVFARAGDSITHAPHFLVPLAQPSAGVDLAGDGSLAETLGFFRSGQIGAQNSFSHTSTAARSGWTSADVLAHLPGELAVTMPGFVLVMVGTNDISAGVPLEEFRQNLTAIAQVALGAGVVPVLSTIPDVLIAPQYQQRQPEVNQTIQEVAESLGVPLWNYWRALQRLPRWGVSTDLVHPSVSPAGGGDFTESGLQYGYNVRNLTALQTLDKLRRILIHGAPPDWPGGAAAWVPLGNALVVAAGDATGFQVQILDTSARRTLFAFDPFPGFRGSVRLALGDVNGDAVPDLIAAPGAGGPPHVRAFSGLDGAPLASFFAFDPALASGLSVAAADVNGDGRAEVVVCPESGAPAHVKVFTAAVETLASFYAFEPSFLGGARLAAADANADGFAEVFVAAGAGGHGHVAVFSGPALAPAFSFLPFGGAYPGEVSLAACDADGDGRAELAVGMGAGAPPGVALLRPLSGLPIAGWHAYAPDYLGGVELATIDRAARRQLVTASRVAAAPDLRVYEPLTGGLLEPIPLYEVGFRRGLSLGG